MSKLGVLLFVIAASACCISAYPSAVPSVEGNSVRVARAALPDPDPRHHHHHHHHGYDGDYYGGYNDYGNYGGYPGYYGNQGYGGYGNHYPQNNGYSNSQASANAASINTPYGGASFAQANANSGSGGGLFSG